MGCASSQLEEPYTKSNCERSYSRISKRNFSDDYFTLEQKNVIRMSWVYLEKDPVDKGTRIFTKIFNAKPQTKSLFPFRTLTYEEMLVSPLFKGHAVRFMHAVGSVVKNLDALDVICSPTLVRLGSKHAWIHNFIDEYLEVFKSAIQEVFEEELGRKSTSEMMDAWNGVFDFIAAKMNEGYQNALQQQNTTNVESFHESDSNTDINKTGQNMTNLGGEQEINASDNVLDNTPAELPNSPDNNKTKAHLNISPSAQHKSDVLNTNSSGRKSDLNLEEYSNEHDSSTDIVLETENVKQSNKPEINKNSKLHNTGNGYINAMDKHNVTLSNITPLVRQNGDDKQVNKENGRSSKSNCEINNEINDTSLTAYNAGDSNENNSPNGDLLNKEEPTFL